MQIYMRNIRLESGIQDKTIAPLFENYPLFNVSLSTNLGHIDFIDPKTRKPFFTFKSYHEEDKGEYIQDVRDGYISISCDTIQPYMRIEFGKNGKPSIVINLWNEVEAQIQKCIKKGLVKESYLYSSSKMGYEEDNEKGVYKGVRYTKKSHTYKTGKEIPGDYGDPLIYQEFRRISWVEAEIEERRYLFPDLWAMGDYINNK